MTRRLWWTLAVATGAVAAAGDAAAGEGHVRLAAGPGTVVEGEVTGARIDPLSNAMLDDAGDVLFSSAVLSDSGSSVRGVSWFLATGSGVRRIVSGFGGANSAHPLGDPVPAAAEHPAVLALPGYTVRSVSEARLSRSGRTAFVATAENGQATTPVILLDPDGSGIRAVAAPDVALPGVACPLSTVAAGGDADQYGIHDGRFLFAGAYDLTSCDPSRAGRRALFTRIADAPFAELVSQEGALGTRVTYRQGLTFPRMLPDGAAVFRALVRDGAADTSALMLHDPLASPASRALVVAGDTLPGTGAAVRSLLSASIGRRPTAGAAPHTSYAVDFTTTDGCAVFDSTSGADTPVVASGATAGGHTFTGARLTYSSRVEVVAVDGGVVFVGAVDGPDVSGSRIGVWRWRAAEGLSLLAYPGMTFSDGGTTFTTEGLVTVLVSPSGRVGVEMSFRESGAQRAALLLEDAQGALVTALRNGDVVPRATGQGRVLQIGKGGTPSFPDVYGTGDDGRPARLNDRGEALVALGGSSTDGTVAKGLYVVSLGVVTRPVQGAVKVKARKGRVSIRGGKGDDVVRVDVLGGGMVRITGVDGTEVNGGAGPLDVDASKLLDVRLDAGDDTFEMTSDGCGDAAAKECDPETQWLRISTGPGSDDVTLSGLTVGRLTYDLGGGGSNPADVDTGRASGLAAIYEAEFGAGSGRTQIDVDHSSFLRGGAFRGGGVSATMRTDHVTFGGRHRVVGSAREHGEFTAASTTFGGDLTYQGSRGSDRFELDANSTVGGRLRVATGPGTSSVTLACAADSVDVRGGSLEDEVELLLASFRTESRRTVVRTLSGDDLVRDGSTGSEVATFDLGAGSDEAFIQRLLTESRLNLRLRLGPGDDLAEIRDLRVDLVGLGGEIAELLLDGGKGTDRVRSNVASVLAGGGVQPDIPDIHSVLKDIDDVVTLAKR